jgi:hypothetical protein
MCRSAGILAGLRCSSEHSRSTLVWFGRQPVRPSKAAGTAALRICSQGSAEPPDDKILGMIEPCLNFSTAHSPPPNASSRPTSGLWISAFQRFSVFNFSFCFALRPQVVRHGDEDCARGRVSRDVRALHDNGVNTARSSS